MIISRCAILAVLCISTAATGAVAGPILDRVKSAGVVHCSGFERPGLAVDFGEAQAAEAEEVGQDPAAAPWHGLEVELCRAVALAVLGSPDKIDFHGLEGAEDLLELAKGNDDIAFLTARELHMTGLTAKVVPGPAVYIENIAAMLPAATGVEHLQDADATKGVCFANGSSPEHVLPAYFASVKRQWLPVGYTEDGEMIDAYNVQQCQILAGERTTLAMTALQRGVNGLKSRILPEPFVSFPIMATTGINDGEWSAVVAWTVYTLLAGDRLSTDWSVGGVGALPVPPVTEALEPDWQARVLKTFGGYSAIYARTLGARSPLNLPQGLNATLDRGGALTAPIFD